MVVVYVEIYERPAGDDVSVEVKRRNPRCLFLVIFSARLTFVDRSGKTGRMWGRYEATGQEIDVDHVHLPQ